MDKISIQHNRGAGQSAAAFSLVVERPHMTLDIREDHCPITYVKTKLTLESMERGQTLELLIKGEEPLRNVPLGIRREGHKIIWAKKESNYYRLLIRKA